MGYADRSYSYRYGRGGFGGGGTDGPGLGSLARGVTPWVKWLLVANGAVFVLMAVDVLPADWAIRHFGFSPASFPTHPWSPLTYMFLHGGFWHLLVNMVVLFFFGPPLERTWGGQAFLKYYLVAGLGGALFSILFLPLPVVGARTTVIGASGAIFGVMLAFALLWPDARVYIWGILPMRAKWFVGLLAAFTLYASFTAGSGVAHWAHLGGLATGFAYLRWGEGVSAAIDRLVARWERMLTSGPQRAGGGGTDIEPRRRRGGRGRRDQDRGDDPREDVLDEVDRILDKIREHGLDSLTEEEREFLDEMSRRYRG